MDDQYKGFNDYNYAYDTQHVLGDKTFQDAIARSSLGRRSKNSAMQTSTARIPTSDVVTSSSGFRGVTKARKGSGITTGSQRGVDAPRPMTAVRAAGYSGGSSFDPMKMASMEKKSEESSEEKCREMERKVNDLVQESILAWKKKDAKLALEKAKEAGRKERAVVKLREQLSAVEQLNLDLTFTVLLNLAHQYMENNLLNEALNTYQVIVKNKLFANSGRLKVNIGNIYFKKKDYSKAIKYYRMAIDQVPSSHKNIRTKILNNIGISFIKRGEYEEALNAFEQCVEEKGGYGTALNLILTLYCLDDAEKMKDAFQRLLEIPFLIDDDLKYMEHQNFLLNQAISNDSLKQWEHKRRQTAESTILTAARIISSSISHSYAEGYAWCVEVIKQSVYANLAMELEMNKAIEHLHQGDLIAANQILAVFSNKDNKVASAAANNLALISLLQGPAKIDDAIQFCEQSLNLDRYNPNALVNRGNIFFVMGDLDKAFQYYKEALNNEASCIQALYNMGYVCRLQGKLEAALDYFYKLNNILLNNVEVLCQLAAIYESLGDSAQAIELYSQANNLAPTDPAILVKLANIYDAEGDKSQAFQCHYDSYRYFPSNISVIKWLGAYYIDAQFPEKAVLYFEKAAIMQPDEIKWQLMMASCQRRSGNYQKALELYRQIHHHFPHNIECLKFLVRICTDLKMPEAKEFMEKLMKAEKTHQLRMQRENDSSHGKVSSAHSVPTPTPAISARSVSQNRQRTSSARPFIDNDDAYQITQTITDSADCNILADSLQIEPIRPRTSNRNVMLDETFEDVQFDESLLPE